MRLSILTKLKTEERAIIQPNCSPATFVAALFSDLRTYHNAEAEHRCIWAEKNAGGTQLVISVPGWEASYMEEVDK